MRITVPPLAKITLRHAHRSFREFRYLVAVALMPVWLGAVFKLLQSHDPFIYLAGYLTNGEALLLSSATVGPLLFTIISSDLRVEKGGKLFPLREMYILTILVICILSAAILGFKTALGPDGVLSANALSALSGTVAIVSVIVWFAVVGTQSAREAGASELMIQAERDFVDAYGHVGERNAE